ncbi:unconventional myosin-XVIIIa isoform X2 [Cryptotermes secundus]|uniref:unconventional myosin-XVIIIa isoform X2 n=1 Tax=Cryptotermes secundus TaxID=105785 RepID=UPI000CD7BB3F|nr:unconventional myosin-XVIIIa isoform X2 [Cryptotermes secundus]
MFNFMKKGGIEKEEKEKRKKEKKERKENKKRDRGSMTADELLRLDEVRRSLKIRGRRKEKEKLPSGITADYSASFFASLDHGPEYVGGSSSLPGHHISSTTPASPSPSSCTSSWIRSGGGDTLTQSDSSEASLTSLNNPSTISGSQQHSLPPLPPRPPKRGILKGPRLSGSSAGSGENVHMNNHGENNHSDSNILVRNTLQNEVIAYQNVPQMTTNSRLGISSSACFIVKESTSSLALVSGLRDNIDGRSDHYHHRGSPPDSSRASDEFLPSSMGSGDHSAYLTAPIAMGTNADTNNKLLTVTSTSPSADSLTDTTTTNSSFATPPFSLSPVGESQGFVGFHNRWNRYCSGGLEDTLTELPLPPVIPVPLPKPRELTIQRQPPPRGDFGFSLRRAMVTEKLPNGQQHTRAVIFAEPGVIVQHNNETGLLPGDRLLEVNGVVVDDKSREEIIDLIKSSGSSVTVKVQPVAELCELTRRSGLDGTEVELDDANIRGGTLRRSGSRRFKKTTQAKSDEQLATERAWLEAERLWLVHRAGFSAVRRLPEEFSASGGGDSDTSKLHIRLEATEEVLQVDDDDVEKANPPQFDRAEDLAHLRYLNESSVLHTLRQRYGSNLIHTYAGGSMVVINPMAPLAIYSEKVVHMFRGCKSEDMPPHIYSLAQSAYHGMLASRRDHSIVLLGRSGSGKTTNFKHILHYLVLAAGAVNKVVTVEKLNAISMVLEAFGNSRTMLNTNATRFTQILSLDYDQSGQIASASVQVLLAERSRVARRPEGEPTFHIFYRLLAGVEGTLRRELHLDSLTGESNLFMTPLQRHEDKQKAMLEFARVCTAMQALGFSEAESKVIWSVLAAIYHLGIAGAVKGGSNSSRWHFSNPQAAQQAARLLGTTVEELARVLFGHSSGGMGTPSTPRAPFRTPSPTERVLDRDVTGLEALEGMVIGLYGEVLNAVAALINRSISTPIHTVSSLVVVDSPGFQNPASCGQQGGATFEDLCHNYLQERLQLLFHHTTLVAPKDRYTQEHIELNLEGGDGDLCTPGPLVSLLDRTSQNSMVRTSQTDLREADRRGLLWLLDEEAVYPSASDEGFLERLFTHYGDRDHQLLLRKAPGNNQFILQHLQGTNPVLYTASGWLKSSRENPIARSSVGLLQESSREEVNQLFLSVRGPGVSSALGGSVVGIEGTQSLRRASSIRRTFTTGTAGIKRKSVCLQVKFTVDGLVETLRRTKLKFVHCFLPHHNAALGESVRSGTLKSNSSLTGSNMSDDLLINIPLVRSQLRGAQILDAVRLHKQGFPKFLPLSEFRRRFRLLAPADGRPASPVLDERRAAEDMLLGIDIDMTSYRVGLSQIFFRSGVLAQLEAQRDERLTDNVVRLQARCRGYLARRKLNKLKIQDLAVRCIQRNVRKFMSVRDWPWWRLLVRVTPLLNVHRTEEELKIKTEELEQLRAKVEKLEQERTHLKHDNDRLEAKLSEMTADLAEEHSTSTLATERLEAETADRLRLEKELQDVQSENKNLQQATERLEMELLYMRASDVNGGVGSDEDGECEEDAGVYKQRYERTVRELEFTRRRLQQQHEDDLEQLVGLKKQLEKKLADAFEEVEEQRQVVGQWKRKVQKLTAETNDLRLLLEEQNSRNHLLEKKQRKFDSELQLMHDELRQEKQQKDRISREKELLIAEKYSLEQNLSAVRLELELKEEKVASLARELDELTFGGKTEEEVAHLKKTKHEMDKKLKEQEEELDDFAGQVQLLEQAKLRLEMSLEQQRKENRRELAQRDEELEDVRCNAHKKVKALEAQLESEHEERTQLLREKHELERRLGALEEEGRASRATDEDQLHRLRKDLRRTKALLRDAQTQLERSRGDSPGKAILRQLRNQLEDVECARSAAVKARQSAEMELGEVQAQLDESQRLKAEAEERAAAAIRERSDIRTQLEENEEELAEVLKKYRTVVQQLSVDQMALQEQAGLVAELESERSALKEQLAELSSRLESIETHSDPSSSLTQRRLELRTKELESRLELEQTTRARMEVQISRLKETVEKLQGEAAMARAKEQTAQDAARKLQRSVRELKEEASAGQARENEAAQRRKDLEKRLESADAEAAAARGDLRLALTRIQDLQSAIQGELEDCSGSDHSDSDQDSDCSDESINTFLSNHKMPLGSSTANSNPRVRTPLELDIVSRSLKNPTKVCTNVRGESQESFA